MSIVVQFAYVFMTLKMISVCDDILIVSKPYNCALVIFFKILKLDRHAIAKQ